METVMINGQKMDLSYKTSSDMRTRASYKGRTPSQGLSCDVYSVDDSDHIVLVLTSVTGDIRNSVTIISPEAYSKISDLHDPCASGTYHTALLEACGAENHLKLL